jgi:hypothetical protein
MGWLCSTDGDAKTCIHNFGGKCMMKRIIENCIKIDIKEADYENGRLLRLAQDYVRLLVSALSVLNPRFIIPENVLFS